MAAIRLNFILQKDGGEPFKYSCGPREIFAWENTNRRGLTYTHFKDGGSLVAAYEMVYTNLKFDGAFKGSLQEFVDAYELEFDAGESEDGDQEDVSLDPTP